MAAVLLLLVLGLALGAGLPSTVEAAILYVDKDESCPGAGTTGSPYCTIQQAFDVVNPGDTVRIRASATPYDGQAVATRNGTSGARITVEPDPGQTPVLRNSAGDTDAAAITLHTDYWTVQHLLFDGAGVHTSQWAIQVRAAEGTADLLQNEILNNTIRNWGGNTSQMSVSDDRAAILVSGGYCEGTPCSQSPRQTRVAGNLIDTVHSTGIYLFHNYDTLIEDNTIQNIRCARDAQTQLNVQGIKMIDGTLNGSTGIIIRNNTIRDFQTHASCGMTYSGYYGYWAGIWCDVGPGQSEIAYNTVYNIDQGGTDTSEHGSAGIRIEDKCTGWTVHHNLISHIGQAGLNNRIGSGGAGGRNTYQHNTVWNTGWYGFSTEEGPVTVQQNIFHNAALAQIHVQQTAEPHIINYNLYYDMAGGGNVGRWNAATTNFATWQSNCACDANSLNVDPQFVNTALLPPDLHLQATSPARGAGQGGVDLGALPYTPPASPCPRKRHRMGQTMGGAAR